MGVLCVPRVIFLEFLRGKTRHSPLVLFACPRAVENVSRFSLFDGVISDAWAEGGVARIMESYSKLACKMLLRRIENIERLKEVA